MENQTALKLDAPRVAGTLARALKSGSRGSLESALGWASGQLLSCRPATSLETERRELLLGIVESLGGLLHDGRRNTREEQLKACRELLSYVQSGSGEESISCSRT